MFEWKLNKNFYSLNSLIAWVSFCVRLSVITFWEIFCVVYMEDTQPIHLRRKYFDQFSRFLSRTSRSSPLCWIICNNNILHGNLMLNKAHLLLIILILSQVGCFWDFLHVKIYPISQPMEFHDTFRVVGLKILEYLCMSRNVFELNGKSNQTSSSDFRERDMQLC